MDAGPHFSFANGISLMVDCKNQEEVDRLYDGLAEGGEKQPCGWVKDRWGVSWQIVPSVLGELMGGPDRAKAQRVMEAHDDDAQDRHCDAAAGVRSGVV